MLRLALQAFTPGRRASTTMTLVVHDGDKQRKYLSGVSLSKTQPEFFVVDCNDLRSKSIQLDFQFNGPPGSHVVLWEAAFVTD